MLQESLHFAVRDLPLFILNLRKTFLTYENLMEKRKITNGREVEFEGGTYANLPAKWATCEFAP